MEHKTHICSLGSFVFFVAFICVVDIATTSGVTTVESRRSTDANGDEGNFDVCADIIGPQWKITKQRNGPCQTLVVWVPKKVGFTEFVKVDFQNEVEGGFSIAIFCYALHLLPFNVQPIFKPFIDEKGESNGTYDQLVQHIEGKTCEAVVGDVTVRASRTPYVDFTSPYLSSEVYMVVRASHQWNQSLWTFLKPFTGRVWISIVGICIYVGLAIAILEYRAGNPRFTVPIHKRVIMGIWFPISTFFFQEGRIHNKNTKLVLGMWLCMLFIILQIFTATLSAWLTIDQMRPKFPSSYENVGYANGSFMREFIIQKYNCSGTKLVPLETIEEFEKALSTGRVDAIFDELPYIDLFLAKYDSNYMKFGPINQESGIAFAFPHGSPLLYNVSMAVINVTENDIMMEMKKKYLGFRIPDGSQPNHELPQSLDIQSFIGLFTFIWVITIGAIIHSKFYLGRPCDQVPRRSGET